MARPDQPLKAAVVGAGLMGTWHARAVRPAGGRLVAVVDRDLNAATRLAQQHPGARAYQTLEALLAADRPDLVHLCTPLDSHLPLGEALLDAGVHLLVEKPLASSAAATRSLLERAAGRQLLVCPVHQFPFQRGFDQARRWLGEIGSPTQISFVIRSAGGDGLSAAETEQIMVDILPHPLSLLQSLLDIKLEGVRWESFSPRGGEMRVSGVHEGCSITFEISMNGRPTANKGLIVGRDGTIHLDFFHGFAFKEPGQVSKWRKMIHPFDQAGRQMGTAALNLGRRVIQREAAYPGLSELITRFYSAVRADGPLPMTPEAVLDVALVRDLLIAQALPASQVNHDPQPKTERGGSS